MADPIRERKRDDEQSTNQPADEGNEEGYQSVPEGFESDLEVDKATVPTDPVIREVNGSEVAVVLASQDDMEEYLERAETKVENRARDESEVTEQRVSRRMVVDVLQEHYISPTFEDLTPEDIGEAPPQYYETFFQALIPRESPMSGPAGAGPLPGNL